MEEQLVVSALSVGAVFPALLSVLYIFVYAAVAIATHVLLYPDDYAFLDRADLPELVVDTSDPAEPDSPLVVLLHGWPDGPTVWRHQVPFLQKLGYRCAQITLPQFGSHTERSGWGYDYPVVVEMLRRALVRLQVDCANPAVLCAHDWGATYAFRLQSTHPELISRMVAVDVGAHSCWGYQEWKAILKYQWPITAAFLLGSCTPGWTEKLATMLGAPTLRHGHREYQINYPYFYFHLRMLAKLFGLGFRFEEFSSDPRVLARPSCPLLYFFGLSKGNPPINFHSEQWLHRIRRRDGCRVVGVKTGHWVQWREPDVFNSELGDWLSNGMPSRCTIPALELPECSLGVLEHEPAYKAPRCGLVLCLWVGYGGTSWYVAVAVACMCWWWVCAPDPSYLTPTGGAIFKGHSLGSKSHKVKRHWTETLGGVYRYKQEGKYLWVVSCPRWVAAVCATGVSERSSRFQDSLTRVLQNGNESIFTLPQGQDWHKRRKALSQFFTPKNLASFLPVVGSKLGECSDWLVNNCESFDCEKLMIRYTMDVIGLLACDRDLAGTRSGENCRLHDLLECLIGETLSGMYHKSVSPVGLAAQSEAWRLAQTIVSDYVRSHQDGEPTPHLLGYFSAVQEAMQSAHCVEGLVDNPGFKSAIADLLLLFVAGHETTGHTLAWTIWLVTTHSEVGGRLCRELDQLPSDGTVLHSPSDCSYLNACLYESMRLKPASANGTGRIMSTDLTLDGVTFSRGDSVNCAFYSVHTSTELWGNDAMSFRPERWLDDPEATRAALQARSCFVPFSMGPRNCVGQQLALFEMRVTLCYLFRRFEFGVVGGQVEETCGINLCSKAGIHLSAKERGVLPRQFIPSTRSDM